MMPLDVIECLLLATGISGISFIAYQLFGTQVILVAITVLLTLGCLGLRRWRKLRQKGLISMLGSKARSILLERSILDVFRDLVYFPYVTKVLGAYIHIAAAKPSPDQVQEVFKDLPKEVSELSNRKGLLSLAPSFIEEVVLPSHNREILPASYGAVDQKWDNLDKYFSGQEQVHEQTLQQKVIHFLDGKLGWPTAIGLAAITIAGAAHMHPRRFKKMLMQNATFVCLLLSLIALLIKARKAVKKQKKPALRIEEKQA